MSMAKKCDKCGELYDEYDVIPYDFGVHQVDDEYDWNRLDLCPSCHVDLTLWMQNKAEFTLKEVTDDGTDGI